VVVLPFAPDRLRFSRYWVLSPCRRVHFGCRHGHGNLVKIGVISGLIGLYEEQACVKIGEIFDALFKPADKGKDPLETNKAVILAPVVTDVQQTGRTIMVVGTGFVKDWLQGADQRYASEKPRSSSAPLNCGPG